MRAHLLASTTLSTLLSAGVAAAGSFDELGRYVVAPDATVFEPFVAPDRFVPEDVGEDCGIIPTFQVVEAPDALEGGSFARVQTVGDCPERFRVNVPEAQASYRATVWLRHGSAGARVIVAYPEETGRPTQTARMAPTGRATSDGWIELASNAFPVDGTLAPNVYLRFADFADEAGVDLDAFELVPEGAFVELPACAGVRDPACGSEAICVGGQCHLGRLSVPPLPEGDLKPAMIAQLRSRIDFFYGGRKTRLVDLPVALATIDTMHDATTAWQFWSRYGQAFRELHDWHTSASAPVAETATTGRLNACFIEGDADRSRNAWASHPTYPDVLVSHVGNGSGGLAPGDRLVAIDGLHPIEWAKGLVDVDWGYHVACDDHSYSDFVEALGGGGGSLVKYAETIGVVRCSSTDGACGDVVETIRIADLPAVAGGPTVRCDNRPRYHLGSASPDEATHRVQGIHHGRVDDTLDEEAIYGMVWDTLYGGGDPNGYVNGTIRGRVTDWKANARGVILDHRAGNGGTLDAPEYLTQLVRPQQVLAVVRMPIFVAGDDGPATPAQGITLFQASLINAPYTVGAPDHDPTLPVALITHRDGSASDYLPFGMKGAPKVRLFGPGPTAGAFSTFIEFAYWGGMRMRLASGDTISFEGKPLIGHGVEPDEKILPKQSDLLAGVDTLHEAALAWVRSELKPLPAPEEEVLP